MHFECTIATPAPARIRHRLCSARLTYLSRWYPVVVDKTSVRTSLDIPIALHRRLRAAAARQGCSVHHLILRSIERAVQGITPQGPKRRLRLDPPIVPSTGKPFDLTNEQIYDLIAFP
jgi:hypothetical protein